MADNFSDIIDAIDGNKSRKKVEEVALADLPAQYIPAARKAIDTGAEFAFKVPPSDVQSLNATNDNDFSDIISAIDQRGGQTQPETDNFGDITSALDKTIQPKQDEKSKRLDKIKNTGGEGYPPLIGKSFMSGLENLDVMALGAVKSVVNVAAPKLDTKYLDELANNQQDYWKLDVGDSEAKKFASEITSSIATSIPIMLTKAAAAPLFGVLGFGGKYLELTQGGEDTATALKGAAAVGLTEFITENPVAKAVWNPVTKSFLSRLFKTMWKEVGGEEIANVVDSIVDKTTINKDMTIYDFMGRAFDTAVVTVGQVGVTTAVIHQLASTEKSKLSSSNQIRKKLAEDALKINNLDEANKQVEAIKKSQPDIFQEAMSKVAEERQKIIDRDLPNILEDTLRRKSEAVEGEIDNKFPMQSRKKRQEAIAKLAIEKPEIVQAVGPVETSMDKLDRMVAEIKATGEEIGYGKLKETGATKPTGEAKQSDIEKGKEKLQIDLEKDKNVQKVLDELDKLKELQRVAEEATGTDLTFIYRKAISDTINELPNDVKIEVKSAYEGRKPVESLAADKDKPVTPIPITARKETNVELRKKIDEGVTSEEKGELIAAYTERKEKPTGKLVGVRADVALRGKIEDMSDEDKKDAINILRKKIKTSEVSGIPSIAAYNDSDKKPVQVSMDADNLKWFNDTFSHAAGNKLLKSIGDAIKSITKEGYHASGDEFIFQFDTEAEAKETMEAIRKKLRDSEFDFVDKQGKNVKFKGSDFTYGIAKDLEKADMNMVKEKERREAAGEKGVRKGTPVGIEVITEVETKQADIDTLNFALKKKEPTADDIRAVKELKLSGEYKKQADEFVKKHEVKGESPSDRDTLKVQLGSMSNKDLANQARDLGLSDTVVSKVQADRDYVINQIIAAKLNPPKAEVEKKEVIAEGEMELATKRAIAREKVLRGKRAEEGKVSEEEKGDEATKNAVIGEAEARGDLRAQFDSIMSKESLSKEDKNWLSENKEALNLSKEELVTVKTKMVAGIVKKYGIPDDVYKESISNIKKHFKGEKPYGDKLHSGIGLDPDFMKDVITVVRYKIEQGAKDFYQTSQAMIKEYGETIRPYLHDAWKVASETSKVAQQTDEPSKDFGSDKPVKFRTVNGKQIPVATEGDYNMVKQTLTDIRPGLIAREFTNPIHLFEEIDRNNGTKFKDMLYRPYHAGEKAAISMHEVIQKDIKEIKKGLTGKSSYNIGTYAVAQQEGGKEVLDFMGIDKVPTLTKNETVMYNKVRGYYEWMYNELNQAREKMGLSAIKYKENYFTFWRLGTYMERKGQSILTASEKDINAALEEVKYNNIHPRAHKFQFLRRANLKEHVDLNFLSVFNRYTLSALRHIYISPVVAKARDLSGDFNPSLGDKALIKMGLETDVPEAASLRDQVPLFHDHLVRWADHIVGVKNWREPLRAPRNVEEIASKLSNNIALFTLSFNGRSAFIQPSSMVPAAAMIGPNYMTKGLFNSFKRSETERAFEQSEVLKPRKGAFETAVFEAFNFAMSHKQFYAGKFGETIAKGKEQLGELGLKMLQIGDMKSAVATWLGAYSKGIELDKMSHAEAIKYADDIVIKTQASALKGDVAPIQRTALGKSMTLFQTFVIGQFNNIVNDAVGYKNSTVSKQEAAKRVMLYVVGMALMGTLYEDLLGLSSPFPTPFRKFMKTLKEKGGNEDYGRALFNATKEMVEFIPLVGGSVKYGTSPLGAVGEVLGSVAAVAGEKKGPKPSIGELAGKVVGIPGGQQLTKSIRAAKEPDADFYDILMGVSKEHNKSTLKYLLD